MNFLKKNRGLLVLGLLLLLLILIPFGLWEETINGWADTMLHSKRPPGIVAGVIGGLLALDIVLPVPSSVVSTASGLLLGFGTGTLVSSLGMCAGCFIGYELGRRAGRKPAQRLVGEKEYAAVSALMARHGDRAITVCRAVPVLAEASVLLAGTFGMEYRRFALLTIVSNLGISLVYAAVGAYALKTGSFLFAFLGAMLLPLLVMAFIRPSHRNGEAQSEPIEPPAKP